MGINIFVYGTLRVGERNDYLLEKAKLKAEQAWTYGELHDTGYGYPVLKESETVRVYGELYEITTDELVLVDQLEEYNEFLIDNLYHRKLATVFTDMGEFDAFVYFAGKRLTSVNQLIPYGDWKVYQNNKHQKDSYYFAYGSCMDDERFFQYNVKQYFTDIIGRGVLPGYTVKFTLNKGDGGKADMVEDRNNHVEGVVYRIPAEALKYLYWREGVDGNWYRPAIVNIQTQNGVLYNVLTFFVIDKGEETAPSELYKTEILRGGKPYLSELYFQKLENHMKELKNK